uniref:Gamma-glutamylcyclotransferase family protein n=1 Tax=Arion vulgaris TaxID=1028688 RepID=A0A0B6YAY5_9EUPU
MAKRHMVFLYGTLKSGQPNFRVLSDPKTGAAKLLGNGLTVKRYPMVITPQYLFPFLLPVEGKGEHIEGEVYEVNEVKLKRLDEFEGHPDFYVREQVPIAFTRCKNHSPVSVTETLDCWVYFLPQYEPVMIELPYLKNYSFTAEDK